MKTKMLGNKSGEKAGEIERKITLRGTLWNCYEKCTTYWVPFKNVTKVKPLCVPGLFFMPQKRAKSGAKQNIKAEVGQGGWSSFDTNPGYQILF